MDAVSAVSSVLTVIELSAKLASICLEYSTAVKNAKPEILRLRETSTSLGDPFKSMKKLTEGPHRDRLQHPESLHNEIQRCEAELKELKGILETKLNSKSDKTMRRFGLRALQWPFESKEVEKRIAILEQSRRAVSDALNIDQTYDSPTSLVPALIAI